MADAFRSVDVMRIRGEGHAADRDRAATEEPLEIRLHGRSFAVIMRTPGADRELAAGFLLSEQVLRSSDDLGTIEHCRDGLKTVPYTEFKTVPDTRQPAANRENPAIRENAENPANREILENIVNVTLANRSAEELDRVLAERRQVTTNSSCGLCGRLSIDSLRSDAPPLRAEWTMPRSFLVSMPERLRAAQAVFHETGGLHAAGLFTRDGRLDDIAEDVGRHNAVDKVIGRMLMRDALPLSNHALFVSGRTSFEIVQKALFGGIPLVASVSAPSSLAIELANDAGITLVGFVRGEGFNIYSHPGRVT